MSVNWSKQLMHVVTMNEKNHMYAFATILLLTA